MRDTDNSVVKTAVEAICALRPVTEEAKAAHMIAAHLARINENLVRIANAQERIADKLSPQRMKTEHDNWYA